MWFRTIRVKGSRFLFLSFLRNPASSVVRFSVPTLYWFLFQTEEKKKLKCLFFITYIEKGQKYTIA